MTDETGRRKFGRVAYGVGFAFVVAGIALYQSALRHYAPTFTIGDGWYDWGQGLGAAAFGAFSSLVGGVVGYLVERRLRA